MYSVHSKEIKERYSVSPTEPEELTCQDYNHWEYVKHEVSKDITYPIILVWLKHIIVVLAEVIHGYPVGEHYSNWYPFAKPPKEP